jgi:hypothetical protein
MDPLEEPEPLDEPDPLEEPAPLEDPAPLDEPDPLEEPAPLEEALALPLLDVVPLDVPELVPPPELPPELEPPPEPASSLKSLVGSPHWAAARTKSVATPPCNIADRLNWARRFMRTSAPDAEACSARVVPVPKTHGETPGLP